MFYNDDQQEERPKDWFRNYDYDSWYIGLGSTGEVLTNLRYGTEWVIEGGSSQLDKWPAERKDIHAWAFDNVLDYMPHWRMQPRFIGEYMFASGDGDRPVSPTDVLGGNSSGRTTGFVGFGYRDTGLSFGPLLSNVHIWRMGAAFKPLEKIEFLRNFETGTDWFLYARNHSSGAVSDVPPTSTAATSAGKWITTSTGGSRPTCPGRPDSGRSSRATRSVMRRRGRSS